MFEKLKGPRRRVGSPRSSLPAPETPVATAWAGTAYAELVVETLAEERARKASVEQRGGHVITSSVAIAGALVGLAAFVPSFSLTALPVHSLWLFVVGLACLGLAAMLGLVTNWPLDYDEVDPDELQRLIEPQYWDAAGTIGQRRVAEVRVSVIAKARTRNGLKATMLTWAMGMQIGGLILIVAAVGSQSMP